MLGYFPSAAAIAIGFWLVFRNLWLRYRTRRPRVVLLSAAIVLAIPAVLFLSYYLVHWPDSVWYINFRSLPGIEALSGLIGGLLGVICAAAWPRPRLLQIAIVMVAIAVGLILLIVPFGKQLLFARDCSTLDDRWTNGVCLQTSGSTCVPASCATVVRILGGNLTERQLATEAGTTLRGTEIWYMKRALRRHGYDLQAHVARSVRDIPASAVVGVMIGSCGHVVALMSKNKTGPEIGDPIGSRRTYTWQGFEDRYSPKLMYFRIKRYPH